MSRSHEAFREADQIDWYARAVADAEIQDGIDSEEYTEPRFYTPVSIPAIPKVKDEGYNAFDSMSKEDIERFRINEKNK